MKLRWYQSEAVQAVYRFLRDRKDNPCVVLPTGAGKTPTMAAIVRDAVTKWGGRVLILAHVKELLEQSAEKLAAMCPDVKVGLYSAGLGRKDMSQPVIVGGIQSIYQRACDFNPFDLVLVDEAHLIPTEDNGMYRQFLANLTTVNPAVRIIGFTATPYRLKDGFVCDRDHFLNEICYEVGVKELIAEGFLSRLRSKSSQQEFDTSSVPVRGGEFVGKDLDAQLSDNEVVKGAVEEIIAKTAKRTSTLIFCSGVMHASVVAEVFDQLGHTCKVITGNTAKGEREELLTRFKAREIKYLANVNVLTTGFDAPNVDCVAMLRPTLSPGLYYQMVGRGLRLCDGKEDCLVLDFGGNIRRHGPIDQMKIKPASKGGGGEAPVKVCPHCDAVNHTGRAACSDCGYEWPPEEVSHDATADNAAITTDELEEETHDVQDVNFRMHTKREADEQTPKTLRVEYILGLNFRVSEWICFEHGGYAREKAEAWWAARSNEPCPTTVAEALAIASAGGLAQTLSITIRPKADMKYWEVVAYTLGEIPEGVELGPVDEEMPF